MSDGEKKLYGILTTQAAQNLFKYFLCKNKTRGMMARKKKLEKSVVVYKNNLKYRLRR